MRRRNKLERRVYEFVLANPISNATSLSVALRAKYWNTMAALQRLRKKGCVANYRVHGLQGYVICGPAPLDLRGQPEASRKNLSLAWTLPRTNRGAVRKHLVLPSPLMQALAWTP